MAGNLKLGIEIALQGVEKVTEGFKAAGRSIGSLGDEFKAGLSAGMQQAIKEADRSLSELKTLADDARKSLNIRSDIDIKGDIDKARQSYEDLANSGQATATELNRAKDAMKAKIGELRIEMGKWSGDWEDLGKKAQEYGSKLQGIGATAMIAGAPAFLAGKDAIKAEYDLAGVANTAGLDPAQAEAAVAKWKAQINELARYTNQTQGELIGALGTFVSKGMDPEKALEMLRSVGKAATATGSQVTDIAESMFQAGESLNIPLSQASKSLDMMAAAGAAGSFELKNMAKDLPNLSAKYASLGGTGADALGSITAGAQIAMKTTSDAAIAANNFKNFLDKLAAPETIKNFDKMGVNLTEQVKKGIDSGDLVGYMGKVIADMTQGKAEKLGELFTDVQARDFAMALTQNIDEYKKVRGEVMSAVGTIDQQADVIGRTTQEKIKSIGINFSTSIDEAKLFQTALDGIKSVAEWFAANPEVFGAVATLVTALAVGGAGIVVAGTALSAVGTALGIIAAAGPALALAAPAIATIVGAIAAWKVGEAVGTWANEQINLLVQAFTGGKFATLGTALYDAIEGPNGIIAIFNGIPEKLSGLWDGMKKAGADLIQNLKDGFTAGLKGELGIGDKLASAVAYIKTTAKDWLQVGRDIIQGLIDGVVAKSKEVIDKIKGLGSAAVREMKDILGIKSPSKVFMVIGEQIGEGMAIGMQLKVKNVSEAAKKLGVAAAYGGKDNATALWIKGQLKDYDALVQEMSVDAEQAAKARQKATDALIAEGAKLTASLRTDLERAMDDFDNLERLLDAGAISWDTYAKAVNKTTLALKNADQPEAQKAASAAPVVAREAWQDAAADIERSLTDALMRGFEGSKDAAKNFKDTIVNTLKTAFLKPIAVKISASVMGAVGMGGSGMAAASGAGGGMGVGDMASIGSTLMSGFAPGAASFAIGEGVAGLASAFGASTGVATGVGAFAAYAVPVIGWIAAILSLVTAFGKGGTPHLGTTREFGLSGQNRIVGLDEWRANGGDNSGLPGWLFGEGDKSPYNDAISTFGQQITAVLKADMKALGGTLGKDFALQFGFAAENEAETGSGGYAKVMLNGESVLSIYKRYAEDGKTGIEQYMKEVAPKVELAAIQAATGLNHVIDALADTVDASTASVSAVNELLVKIKDASQALALQAAFDDLNLSMGATDEQIIQVGLALRDLAGSFDALQTGLTAYYQGYFSDAERMADLTESLSEQFAGLNVAMPASKAEFRALVESLDVTSEAGQQAFITLMGLAPAFATVADYADAAANEAADKAKEAADKAKEAAETASDAAARAAEDQARAAADAARDILAAWQNLGNSIIAEIKRIRGLVTGDTGKSYAKAQADFTIATAKARAGDQKAAEALPALSQSLLDIAEGYASTSIDLQRIRAATAASLEGTLASIQRKQGITVPAFASGGNYAGGVALVGESGPELINFARPGFVHTSAQTASLIGNDALIAEVAALREEVVMLRAETRATVSHTSKTARLLERVMPDGDALATRAAV